MRDFPYLYVYNICLGYIACFGFNQYGSPVVSFTGQTLLLGMTIQQQPCSWKLITSKVKPLQIVSTSLGSSSFLSFFLTIGYIEINNPHSCLLLSVCIISREACNLFIRERNLLVSLLLLLIMQTIWYKSIE